MDRKIRKKGYHSIFQSGDVINCQFLFITHLPTIEICGISQWSECFTQTMVGLPGFSVKGDGIFARQKRWHGMNVNAASCGMYFYLLDALNAWLKAALICICN